MITYASKSEGLPTQEEAKTLYRDHPPTTVPLLFTKEIPLSVGRGHATEMNHFLAMLIVRLAIGKKGGSRLRPALHYIGRETSCHTNMKGFVR